MLTSPPNPASHWFIQNQSLKLWGSLMEFTTRECKTNKKRFALNIKLHNILTSWQEPIQTSTPSLPPVSCPFLLLTLRRFLSQNLCSVLYSFLLSITALIVFYYILLLWLFQPYRFGLLIITPLAVPHLWRFMHLFSTWHVRRHCDAKFLFVCLTVYVFIWLRSKWLRVHDYVLFPFMLIIYARRCDIIICP